MRTMTQRVFNSLDLFDKDFHDAIYIKAGRQGPRKRVLLCCVAFMHSLASKPFMLSIVMLSDVTPVKNALAYNTELITVIKQ
jgi:hypothetical protein